MRQHFKPLFDCRPFGTKCVKGLKSFSVQTSQNRMTCWGLMSVRGVEIPFGCEALYVVWWFGCYVISSFVNFFFATNPNPPWPSNGCVLASPDLTTGTCCDAVCGRTGVVGGCWCGSVDVLVSGGNIGVPRVDFYVTPQVRINSENCKFVSSYTLFRLSVPFIALFFLAEAGGLVYLFVVAVWYWNIMFWSENVVLCLSCCGLVPVHDRAKSSHARPQWEWTHRVLEIFPAGSIS